jgi:hypothetical protein
MTAPAVLAGAVRLTNAAASGACESTGLLTALNGYIPKHKVADDPGGPRNYKQIKSIVENRLLNEGL